MSSTSIPTTTRKAAKAPSAAKAKRHRIKDIAQELSLSTATVCRALNGAATVKPETRRRVLQAAREVGYVKDSAAMALRTGRHRRIAVMITRLDNPFYATEAEAARVEAEENGYAVQYYFVNQHDKVEETFERIVGQGIDGLLISGGAPMIVRPYVYQLIRQGMPVLATRDELPGHDQQLTVDLSCGHRQAMDHLIQLGHRHVGLLGYVANPNPRDSTGVRLAGIVESLKAHGLSTEDCLEVIDIPTKPDGFANETMQGAFATLSRRLASSRPMPTAVIATNDVRALAAIAAITQAGLSVPEDVSVVGCDHIETARFACPPLTTVMQSEQPICTTGVRMLLEMIEQPDIPPRHVRLKSSLVIRQSTAPPRT